MSTKTVQEVAQRAVKEEGEAADEEEMEQFFAIIRRFRDARAVADRIRARTDLEEEDGDDDGEEEQRKKKRNRLGKSRGGGSWIPKFELEDFKIAGCSLDSSTNNSALLGDDGTLSSEETKIEEGGRKLKSLDDRLDLTLAL